MNETQAVSSQRLELAERLNSLQAAIYKNNQRLDELKMLVDWNQEEFEQWVRAEGQKEEDNAALAKYSKQDQAKIKQLRLDVEKMSKEVRHTCAHVYLAGGRHTCHGGRSPAQPSPPHSG